MRGGARGTAATAVLVMVAGLTACSSAEPAATPVPDSGFDVATDGFSFQNYANEAGVENLDAAAMRTLFGDKVCARTDGGDCTLYPTAQTWMKTANDAMDGGHCFGMASASWAMFKRAIDPATYGAANAGSLTFTGNAGLQKELATLFATQLTQPTKDTKVVAAPAEAITKLEEAWGRGSGYVLAFYKLEHGERAGGHAITPVAVKDAGNGKQAIVVYDNNFPGKPQQVLVDPANDTWTYRTAADPADQPESYKGGTDNPFELYPIDPMLQPQDCPFCGTGQDAGSQSPTAESLGGGTQPTMIFLNQEAGHSGVSVGVVGDDGKPVPGQQSVAPLTKATDPSDPDIELVPAGQPFRVIVDGGSLQKPANTDVTIIGPGYYYAANNIDLVPGARDVIRYDPATSSASYRTDAGAAPDFALGLDNPEASYSFLFGGLEVPKGGSVDIALDSTKQIVTATPGGHSGGTFDFKLDRITPDSQDTSTSEPIPLAPDESIVVEYGKWTGTGQPSIGIDKNHDGQIDEPLQHQGPR